MPSIAVEESSPVGDKPLRKKPSWATRIVLLVVLAAACVIGWQIYSGRKETEAAAQKSVSSANRPVPVLAAVVQQKTMPIYLTALGSVEAYNTVTVRSRVDGQLLKVNFKEGQTVRKGALLLQIDPEPYAAALELAQGQYAKDEAAATMSKAEAARYQGLFEAGVVSEETQQTQVSNYGQAQGELKSDLAAIHAAKVNLAYTSITSPIDGQVGLRQVDMGNIVHAADANGLVVVTQLEPIAVIFTVPEDQLPLVRKKLLEKKPLKVDAYDRSMTTRLATGTLLTVDNQIDATTGTDKLKAVFPNKDKALFPNQFVNVQLVLENRPNVLLVPAAALQMGNSGNFVYVIKKDNTVDVRNIPNAITQGSQLLLDKGLKPGERVVIDGQEKIHAGSKIVVSKGAPADKSDAAAAGSGKGDAGGTGSPTDSKASSGGKGAKADAATTDDSSDKSPAGKTKVKTGGKGDGGSSGKSSHKAPGNAAGETQ